MINLELCQEMFDRVDKIAQLFRDRKLDNPHLVNEVLQELNGIYDYLNPLYLQAIVEEELYKAEQYIYHKENKEEKNTDTTAKKKADLEAEEYSKIRAKLEGYIKNIMTNITSCQSLIKTFEIQSNIK